ncbi:MAG: isoleucine--tRNA ligase [Bacteroidales bacterium]|nr:isoleucine--tRNA ligase [Bacteroidales bacterium]
MKKQFNEYGNFNLSEINKEVLKTWDANHVFEASMEEREGHPTFVFYEGPPSANGMPGIHHVMARTIKDIICRYKTMQGFQVKRKAGWDTHGLPVELGVEKMLGITKEDIGKKISVDDYNRACRQEVMKYTKEWEDLTHRMGYWVDTKDPYITYDNRYIESVWWLLSQLYGKGYLYKGYTIQPYSPAAGTGLSSHELNQPGCYRDVKDTTCVAQFKIKNPKPEMANWGTPYFLAWTTTPWTLPSNTALCVGPKIEYVAVETFNGYNGNPITVVVARQLLYNHFNKKAEGLSFDDYKPGDKLIPFRIVGEYVGTDLVGMQYEQLFPWVKPVETDDAGNWHEATDKAFRVIPGDYVTTEDGTGIVHIAPTFGADDAFVARAAGIPSLFMINKRGETRPMVDFTGKFYLLDELDERFVSECVDVDTYKEYEGRWVKNAYDPQYTVNGRYDEAAAMAAENLDIVLCMVLKQQEKVFKIEKHVHNYPHCWRTDKPVLYYPLDSWFIKTTKCRERMMQLNETITWKPQSTGTGRFGKWLENLNDWNLSRSRYWGTPLPIWRTEDGEHEICIGSVEQLYNEIERAVEAGVMASNPFKDKGFVPGDYSAENYNLIDLHRPYVDDIILVAPNGEKMKRELDLIDVWFDSGAMPYAQIHYPFENKEAFDNRQIYPADFIAEGVDQTRGWFFTLHAIGAMVFDSVAYKAVISNGLVLDKNGNKMSKRLGNAVDPFGAIEKYGTDPLRWYMISNSSPWDNLRFDEEGVVEVSRKFFSTLFNTYSFLARYANVDGFDNSAEQIPYSERPEIDRWILSSLTSLIKTVEENLDAYEPTRAARAISEFVNDNLSNWYVRLNRPRFWRGEMSDDKLSAYQTLYTCLDVLARLIAPFSPFVADKIYVDLTSATTGATKSVHLAEFPKADESLIDKRLEKQMALAQAITSMGLALRRKANINARKPLMAIMVPVFDDDQRAAIEAVSELLKAELNVKEVRLVRAEDGVLVKKIKLDFKKLGPKCGKAMKQVAAHMANISQADIIELEKNGALTISIDGADYTIDSTDVEIFSQDIPGWTVANEGSLTVALDITINDDLRNEGIARELVNRIQNIRKASGFNITDRIAVVISPNSEIEAAVAQYGEYISRQVLATSLKVGEIAEPDRIALPKMEEYGEIFVSVKPAQ